MPKKWLLCALASQPALIPQAADLSHHCFKCGKTVIVSPSSKRFMDQSPEEYQPICIYCADTPSPHSSRSPFRILASPVSMKELAEEKKGYVPNPRRNSN